jgi:uncharacterized protein (TIGR02284 family)
MEKTTTETIEVLNDLVAINNDRIAGYERALKELSAEDNDLRSLFVDMVRESQEIRNALATEVQVSGGEVETGTTNSGKIYRAWMDVKAAFTGNSRHAVLANCEMGEDAAQRAYDSALSVEELPDYIRQILTEQQQTLRSSHNKIKMLRDAAK